MFCLCWDNQDHHHYVALVTPTAEFTHLNSVMLLPLLPRRLWVVTQIFWAQILGLCRSQREDWRRLLGNESKELHLARCWMIEWDLTCMEDIETIFFLTYVGQFLYIFVIFCVFFIFPLRAPPLVQKKKTVEKFYIKMSKNNSVSVIDIVDLCAYIIPNVSNNVQTQTVSIGRRLLLQSGW